MTPPTHQRKAVEFYSIQLSQLTDGAMFVEVTATTIDDQEPQLLSQEIATERVASLNDALAVIRRGVIGNAA